jgi:uncharacterized protein (DUF2336 family)
LSEADVQRLAVDTSVDNRVSTVAKLARQFAAGSFSDSEQKLAQEIFFLVLQDAEVLVRKSLSENVKYCSFLPREIALSLVEDIEEVSLPIIKFSDVLTDEDLIRIVEAGNTKKQVAVAHRDSVSSTVTMSLVETGKQVVIGTLLKNQGAEVSEESFQKIADQFVEDDNILGLMVEREALPLKVIERLAKTVSDVLHERLLSRPDISPELADTLIQRTYDRAIADLIAMEGEDGNIWDLVCHLYAENRLTPSLILESLFAPDLRFCVASMAKLADMNLGNLADLVIRTGWRGVKLFYPSTDLPKELAPAFRVGIEIGREIFRKDGDYVVATYLARAIDGLERAYQDDDRPQEVINLTANLNEQYRRIWDAEEAEVTQPIEIEAGAF